MLDTLFCIRFARLLIMSAISFSVIPMAYAKDSDATEEAIIIENDDDLVIIDESEETTSDTSADDTLLPVKESYFDKHFSGGMVFSYSGFIGKNTRSNNFLRLRFQEEWEEAGLSVAIVGRAVHSQSNLIFKKEIKEDNGDVIAKKEIKQEFKESAGQLREAYVRWSRPYVDIYAGRRTLALGQFDAFSPVDFLLPVDYSNNTISFSKVTGKYPQTALSTIFYPTNKLEFQLHYFPKIERDRTVKQLLETPSVNHIAIPDATGDFREQTEPFELPRDQSQYLARLLYTGSVIWGLTYYKGFGFFPETVTRLEGDQFLNKNQYRPGEAYGFEVSVPFNQYSVKYEIVSLNSIYNGEECTFGTACDTWKTYIRNKLDNNAYFEHKVYFQALGYDYKSDNWTINLALLQIVDGKTEEQKEAKKISLASVGSDRGNIPENQTLPVFHFAKHYGGNKNHTTGMGFGVFGAAFGASIYHGYKYRESWTFGTSFDYLSYRSNQASQDQVEREEKESGGDNTEVTSVTAPSIRVTLIYDF